MKITKLNEYEYTVKGDSTGTYVVNLMDNSRKGSCTCKHFTMRIQPKWRKGLDIAPCKHIIHTLGHVVWNQMHQL